MTINNGAVTAVEKGTQAFDKVYHANDLVFERYLPTGTVLWSGSKGFEGSSVGGTYQNDHVLSNQSLNFATDKLKTGIQINASKYGDTTGYNWETGNLKVAVQIPKSDLESGNEITVATLSGGFYNGAKICIQKIGDSQFSFIAYPAYSNGARATNSTRISSSVLSGYTIIGWLIIDSITAY